MKEMRNCFSSPWSTTLLSLVVASLTHYAKVPDDPFWLLMEDLSLRLVYPEDTPTLYCA